MIDPGRGRRSIVGSPLGSAAPTVRTGAGGAPEGATGAWTGFPASAAWKKAFWALARASARPGGIGTGAGGQTGGRIGAAKSSFNPQVANMVNASDARRLWSMRG